MSPKNKNKNEISTNHTNDLFDKLNNVLKTRNKTFLIISLLLYLIFSLLLFQPLVSVGGDDSGYIIRAFNFIKKFEFPGYQGPLYPLVLSPFVLLFGTNVIVLKVLSLIFILLFIVFFYASFRERIPAFILQSILVFVSINSSLLFFSSQTYNEAFFIFMQALFFYFFFKKFISKEPEKETIFYDIKSYILLGFMILLMGITRSIAYATLIGVIGYFVLYGRWYATLKTILSFGVVYFIYSMLKKLIWGSAGADFTSQGTGLMYKNYYSPAEGKEDLAGYLQRIIDNANLYLSKHFAVFSSFRSEEPGMKILPVLTVIIIVLFIMSMILFYRKNKFLFFTSVYCGAITFSTFLVLQKNWDQARLIIPYAPLIFLVILSGIYFLLKLNSLKKLQFIIPVIAVFLLFSSLKTTAEKAKTNQGLKGPWYDLTPDWINFIKCGKWADQNLPKNVKIASRKPSISFVYSKGRDFVGIYNFKSMNSQEVFNALEDSVYIVAPFNTVFKAGISQQLQAYLRYNTSFVLNNNGALIGVYKPEPQVAGQIKTMLGQASIDFSVSPRNYFNENKISANDSYTVSPDSLLAVFQNNDVEYIIDASLRINPYAKTDRTINTIQRYLVFIEQKYPGIFEKVMQIGEDNDEPASLYRIKYEMYGLKK